MDTEKTITFGIWGEMGVRSSVKANIMSVKINDFPLPPIRRATCVALSFYILRPRDFFCLFGSVLKPSCKPTLLSTQFHKPI